MLKRKALKQKIGLLLLVVVLVFTIVAAYLLNTYVLPYSLLVPQTFSPQELGEPLPTDEFALKADGKYHWVKHLMRLMQPLQPHFAGKVYLLINGGCYSTCAEFVSTMQFHQKATFIGEEAGGGYYGDTSGFTSNVYLPHTKIVLVLPLVAYYLSVHGYAHADRGVMPDYPVQSTIQDLLAGKDNAMTLALSLARGQHSG